MLKIKVISLKNQDIRRQKMTDFLNESPIQWSFLDAIPGTEIQPYLKHYDQAKRMVFPGHDMTNNEIACFISHREVWKECASSQDDYLILEDDAYELRKGFSINTVIDLLSSIKKSQKNHFIVRLGHGAYRKNFQYIEKLNEEFSLVRYHRDPLCALAYLLTPTMAKVLINQSEKFYLPVDDFMWNGNESDAFVLDIDPVLFSAAVHNNPSTIGQREKKKIKFLSKINREYNRFIYLNHLKKFEKISIKRFKN